jgi:hypothetical protein
MRHHGKLTIFTDPKVKKEIRGCWGSKGKPVEVGLRHKCVAKVGCEEAPLVATAGRCTAASDRRVITGSSFYQLYVVDVRRRVFWDFRSSEPSRDALGVGLGPAVQVVIGRGCAVAWIARNVYGGPDEIRRDDSTGRVVLAKGTDIDLHSLELHGSTVSWTQAGTKHHAHLSGPPRGALRA